MRGDGNTTYSGYSDGNLTSQTVCTSGHVMIDHLFPFHERELRYVNLLTQEFACRPDPID